MNFLSKLYSFVSTPVPPPQTGNLAFYQNTTLPEFAIRGAGRPIYGQFQAFAPQIIQTPVVTEDWYGGLFQGQFISQPLLEPSNRQ